MEEIDYIHKIIHYKDLIWDAIDSLTNIIHEYREDGYAVDDLIKLKDYLKSEV